MQDSNHDFETQYPVWFFFFWNIVLDSNSKKKLMHLDFEKWWSWDQSPRSLWVTSLDCSLALLFINVVETNVLKPTQFASPFTPVTRGLTAHCICIKIHTKEVENSFNYCVEWETFPRFFCFFAFGFGIHQEAIKLFFIPRNITKWYSQWSFFC